MDRAAEELAESHAFDTELTVLETRCCALGEVGTEGHEMGEDGVAAVMIAFRGRLAGTALLAMEPEDALAWSLADGGGRAPIETYVELGGAVLGAVAATGAEALGVEIEIGRPRLEEDSIGGCLVRTHAPSDTVVVASRIEIRAGGAPATAHLLLMMEPKVVSALLGALAVSLH